MDTETPSRTPQFELRCGGLQVTIRRVPTWLVVLTGTAVGSAVTWLAAR
ncbi:hypothetical protein [Streptomyces sp. NPDC018031]